MTLPGGQCCGHLYGNLEVQICKCFDNGVSHSFSNVLKRAEEPRLIGELGQNRNRKDRNVPGGIEATACVLLLAPERAETYHAIVDIVNNVLTTMATPI